MRFTEDDKAMASGIMGVLIIIATWIGYYHEIVVTALALLTPLFVWIIPQRKPMVEKFDRRR